MQFPIPQNHVGDSFPAGILSTKKTQLNMHDIKEITETRKKLTPYFQFISKKEGRGGRAFVYAQYFVGNRLSGLVVSTF